MIDRNPKYQIDGSRQSSVINNVVKENLKLSDKQSPDDKTLLTSPKLNLTSRYPYPHEFTVLVLETNFEFFFRYPVFYLCLCCAVSVCVLWLFTIGSFYNYNVK